MFQIKLVISSGLSEQILRQIIAKNKEKELKRMTYYYDEKTKTNRLDCHYPIIDEKAIKEIVENSLARYIYIYIYNENNVIVNHWSYEVKHGGFHTYEDPEIETKKLLIISIYTGLNIFTRIALGANGLIILADVIISVRRLAKEKKCKESD